MSPAGASPIRVETIPWPVATSSSTSRTTPGSLVVCRLIIAPASCLRLAASAPPTLIVTGTGPGPGREYARPAPGFVDALLGRHSFPSAGVALTGRYAKSRFSGLGIFNADWTKPGTSDRVGCGRRLKASTRVTDLRE